MTLTPSLALSDELAVAQQLYGEAPGYDLIAQWLHDQEARIDNIEYARQFADHLDIPGIAPLDYAHRYITYQGSELLGGIRFYRRDITRPFIEIIAHTFTDLEHLRTCVASEWQAFHPQNLRIRTRPQQELGPHAKFDLTFHAARYSDMPSPPPHVTLQQFDNAEQATELVQHRFTHMQQTNPDLYRNVSHADAEDLETWHAANQLAAIVVENTIVGALAVVPGTLEWLIGDEINEEVISPSFGGHGYAAAAQMAWAHTRATTPTTYLLGTIDHLNIASRRTAQRAGRHRVLDSLFVGLPAIDTLPTAASGSHTSATDTSPVKGS